MTALVTVQAHGGMTRLRRYEARALSRPVCTHEGLYDPESVNHPGVSSYQSAGATQDRVAPGRCADAPARLTAE